MTSPPVPHPRQCQMFLLGPDREAVVAAADGARADAFAASTSSASRRALPRSRGPKLRALAASSSSVNTADLPHERAVGAWKTQRSALFDGCRMVCVNTEAVERSPSADGLLFFDAFQKGFDDDGASDAHASRRSTPISICRWRFFAAPSGLSG